MALFLSTIINKMDAKCRVSVPSTFRNSLQKQTFKGVIAFPSYQNNSIDACGIDRMESISDSLDGNHNYSKKSLTLSLCTLVKLNNFLLIKRKNYSS